MIQLSFATGTDQSGIKASPNQQLRYSDQTINAQKTFSVLFMKPVKIFHNPIL